MKNKSETSPNKNILILKKKKTKEILSNCNTIIMIDPPINILHVCRQKLAGYFATMCPRSSDPFYIVSHHVNRDTTSWTHSSVIYFAYIASSEGLCHCAVLPNKKCKL